MYRESNTGVASSNNTDRAIFYKTVLYNYYELIKRSECVHVVTGTNGAQYLIGKVCPKQAMKAQKGSRGMDLLFL
jgi:hypothetical protein